MPLASPRRTAPWNRLHTQILAGLVGIGLFAGGSAVQACSNAGLNGLYLWPMQVTTPKLTCQVSVQLLFDGKGRGWMQAIDNSCPRPGTDALAGAFRYAIDEECSGKLTDHHGRYQLELENEDVELTWVSGDLRVSGVATRQRELMPGELELTARTPRKSR